MAYVPQTSLILIFSTIWNNCLMLTILRLGHDNSVGDYPIHACIAFLKSDNS